MGLDLDASDRAYRRAVINFEREVALLVLLFSIGIRREATPFRSFSSGGSVASSGSAVASSGSGSGGGSMAWRLLQYPSGTRSERF